MKTTQKELDLIAAINEWVDGNQTKIARLPQYKLLLHIFKELEEEKRQYAKERFWFFPDLTFGEWLFGPNYLTGGRSA